METDLRCLSLRPGTWAEPADDIDETGEVLFLLVLATETEVVAVPPTVTNPTEE